MSKITLGIVAHVDAGKTTLSEAILYKMGVIRKLGRVDNGDSYMDTDEMERSRGITIYSKLARISMGEDELIFIDTPGHVDFSAEMERSLGVLDVAVLVVSGINGVQSHTRTLWKLLQQYNIPTLIFVNKMDITPKTREELLEDIGEVLGDECIDFSEYLGGMDLAASDKEGENTGAYITMSDIEGDLAEELGMCSEKLMEEYLENGILSFKSVIEAILARQAYPVLFGTALKDQEWMNF